MKTSASALLFALAALLASPCRPAGATTITVTTDLDADAADGFCSLREAILAANDDLAHYECPAGSGADRIVFSLALPAILNASSDLPAITETVAIRGPGVNQLTIDGLTLNRLFVFASVSGGEWYLLEDLSVLHGYANTGLGPDGGGAYVGPGDTAIFSRVIVAENVAGNGGGGIAVDGFTGLPAQAEIHDSILSGNLSLGATGGGGLLVVDDSAVEVTASSIVDNRAEASFGAGAGIVIQRSTVAIQRSTISGNSALGNGGGIFISSNTGDAALLSLADSTIYDNLADADFDLNGDGGGISTTGPETHLELENSIIAGNADDGLVVNPDLSLGSFVLVSSFGFNFIGVNEGASVAFAAGSPNANGDFVGTTAAPIDPLLESLALNQGATLSHRPVLDAASLVIDHGACPGRSCDQRGRGVPSTHLRALDHPAVPTHAASDGCDIGSVERGASADSSAELFLDGFELGHALRWSAELP